MKPLLILLLVIILFITIYYISEEQFAVMGGTYKFPTIVGGCCKQASRRSRWPYSNENIYYPYYLY